MVVQVRNLGREWVLTWGASYNCSQMLSGIDGLIVLCAKQAGSELAEAAGCGREPAGATAEGTGKVHSHMALLTVKS